MHPAPLAQSSANIASLWVWILVLIGIVLGGAAVIVTLRRRLLHDRRDEHGAGLIDQLERMRRQGQLSDEEFRRTRDRVLGRVGDPGGGASEPDQPLQSDDDGPDPTGSGDDRVS